MLKLLNRYSNIFVIKLSAYKACGCDVYLFPLYIGFWKYTIVPGFIEYLYILSKRYGSLDGVYVA